ncbi:MAG: trypsin-like peptidase domain-containing protein [Hyphomicrobiaceae bacterium]
MIKHVLFITAALPLVSARAVEQSHTATPDATTFPGGSRHERNVTAGEPRGRGFFLRANDDSHDGTNVASSRSGRGVFTWPNGERYEGDFRDGKRTGHGRFIWPSGDHFEGSFKDGTRHGHGVYTWLDGNRYEGEFRDGKRHGNGVYIWSNGNRYAGTWKDGQRSGWGTLIWTSGNRYEGEFKDGKRHGHGVQIWTNGNRYEGNWKDGERAGHGVLTWQDGSKYQGQFQEGAPHGRGDKDFADGSRYSGEFLHGIFHGQGEFTWSNGNRFIGKWRDGRKQGHGEYSQPSGYRYIGDYWQGEKHGRGVEHFPIGGGKNNRYKGEYQNNFRHGQGAFIWANGDRYDGWFEHNNHHGHGTYVWANGDRYKGNWKDGKRSGRGMFVWANGDRYEGQYLDDKQHGQGFFVSADGARYEGQFRDGHRHGHGVFTTAAGIRYQGEYEHDVPHGHGNFRWANGDQYEGDWENGNRTGEGLFVWANGDRYDGAWSQNRRDGAGAIIWRTKSQYNGIFRGGALVGAVRNAKGPSGIIGKNDRTSRTPKDFREFLPGIGSLAVGRISCTAFCIAPNAIATSQHCVQSSGERWHASSLRYRFTIDHKRLLRTATTKGKTAASRRLNVAYGLKTPQLQNRVGVQETQDRLESDWAIIRLQKNVCPVTIKLQGALELRSRTSPGNRKAAIISAERFTARSSGRRWTYSGDCHFPHMAFLMEPGFAAHTCDGIPGTSGSPIFLRNDDDELVVVAVQSGHVSFRPRTSKTAFVIGRAALVRQFEHAIPHFLTHPRITDRDQLKQIQAELKKKRLLDGKIDGLFGRKTRFAIAAWERSVGLPPLGLPTRLVYDVLTGARSMPSNCDRRNPESARPQPNTCRMFGLQMQNSSGKPTKGPAH